MNSRAMPLDRPAKAELPLAAPEPAARPGGAPHMHAIVPLAVLEAVRRADELPAGDGLDGFGDEDGATLKFGRSETVAVQIERYRRLAVRDRDVEAEEIWALFRLLGRRSDAAIVFADAGRRVGQLAAARGSGLTRLVHRITPLARNRIGHRLVRRAARVFGIEVQRDGTAAWCFPSGIGEGVARQHVCSVFGAATAELLRTFTTFDGALFQLNPTPDDDACCRWSTQPPEGG